MRRICFMLSLIMLGFSFAGESLTNKTSTVSVSKNTKQASAEKKDEVCCKAITKSGKRCKRKKTNNSDYCKQHKLIEEKKERKSR